MTDYDECSFVKLVYIAPVNGDGASCVEYSVQADDTQLHLLFNTDLLFISLFLCGESMFHGFVCLLSQALPSFDRGYLSLEPR